MMFLSIDKAQASSQMNTAHKQTVAYCKAVIYAL